MHSLPLKFTPHTSLATLPTPLQPLEVLSETLGVEVWMKRDDLTGFAMGGNKVRKAEFLLADAIAHQADVVLTAGAVQSNHARVIAAASRRLNVECHLFLSGTLPETANGNLLLDELSDAQVHIVASSAERASAMQAEADRLRSAGRRPYVIPIGGSNAMGAQGYASGFTELEAQARTLPEIPTRLLFATSSGGTYAGLLAGKAATHSSIELLGIRVDLDPDPEAEVARVANELAVLTGLTKTFSPSDAIMNADFVGEGYGLPTQAGREALRMLWQQEGILLDLVYAGKAMAGLIALARQEAFSGERIIFLHTGGAPAVFANTAALQDAP